MGVRLIATDLDGTLLRSDGTVSERSAEALKAAERAGIVVVIATGRPMRWVHPVAEALGHTGLAVCSNGAVVIDLHTEDLVEVRPILPATALKVTDVVRDALPDVTFAVETVGRGFGQEPRYPTHHLDSELQPWIAAIEELLVDDVVKLLIRHEEMGPDDLLAAASDVAGHLAQFTHSSSNGLLEVSALGVTKASTLAQLAADRDIGAEQVVALGDMPNDLPLLAWAGTSYAMANAHPEVLASTVRVAASNDDEGVAQVVEQILITSR